MILCGNTCEHNHESLNGPTGCCKEHGPYMYFCNECHEERIGNESIRNIHCLVNPRPNSRRRRNLVAVMANLTDVKLRITKDTPKMGHFWDGATFDKQGYPVAICENMLYPRDPIYFMTSEEMKEIPFCQKCLSMIER